MVLISIHPFVLRKILLIIAALLCFSALCFADPVLMVRRYPVRPNTEHSMRISSPQRGLLGQLEPRFVEQEASQIPARPAGETDIWNFTPEAREFSFLRMVNWTPNE